MEILINKSLKFLDEQEKFNSKALFKVQVNIFKIIFAFINSGVPTKDYPYILDNHFG